MKGRGGAAVLLVIGALLGYAVYSGAVSADDVQVPTDKEKAAGGLEGFFGWLADFFSGIGPAGWRVISLLALVGLGMWVFKKVPMTVWLVLALVGLVVAVMV